MLTVMLQHIMVVSQKVGRLAGTSSQAYAQQFARPFYFLATSERMSQAAASHTLSCPASSPVSMREAGYWSTPFPGAITPPLRPAAIALLRPKTLAYAHELHALSQHTLSLAPPSAPHHADYPRTRRSS